MEDKVWANRGKMLKSIFMAGTMRQVYGSGVCAFVEDLNWQRLEDIVEKQTWERRDNGKI